MKRSIIALVGPVLLLSIVLFLNTSGHSQENRQTLEWSELPNIPDKNGFNGSFTGIHNDALIVVGGANFPDAPVYEGGAKKYYSSIYVMVEEDGQSRWISDFNYPKEVAYGAKVSLENGLLCIGGKDGNGSFKDVNLVSWNGENIEIKQWPNLPYAMSNMAAARIGDIIYVAGGTADGNLVNKLLMLNTSNQGSDDFVWEEGPDFPGPARLMPVAAAQNTQYEPHFFLFSGSSYPENAEDPHITTNGLEYNPATRKWSIIPSIQHEGKRPFSLHGAAGMPIGAHHILFVGGVNYDRFFKAWKRERKASMVEKEDTATMAEFNQLKYEYFTQEPDWFQFNKELLLYHTISGVWTVAGNYPYQSVAGGGLVKWKDGWIVAGGEIKPGVRTNKVYYGQSTYEPDFGTVNWIVLLVYMSSMLLLGFYSG